MPPRELAAALADELGADARDQVGGDRRAGLPQHPARRGRRRAARPRRSSRPAPAYGRSDTLAGPEDQPGVRLGEPDRPGAHRRRPLGGRRRRAAPAAARRRRRGRPPSTTSTTPAPRSTGSPGRCSPRPRASRRRRTATPGSTSARSPPQVVAERPDAARPAPTTRPQEVFRVEGVALMFDEIQASLARLRRALRRLLQREGPARRGASSSSPLDRLREQGHVYESDGAIWLRTTDFGDDKDRVLSQSNGEWTYFAADCAYYLDKRERGFDRVRDHARRRPPRLRRPDEGDGRLLRRRPGPQPRDPDRTDGQPGPRRRSRCG